MKPASEPLPISVVPRSVPRYMGEFARPTMVYSVRVSPSELSTVMVAPMSLSVKRSSSARHSPALCGRRPAVSDGVLTLPGRLMKWYGALTPPCAAMASRLFTPSAEDTKSSAANSSTSLSVKPSVDMSR